MRWSFSLSDAIYLWDPTFWKAKQVRIVRVIKHLRQISLYWALCTARKTRLDKGFCLSQALCCHVAVQAMQLFAVQKKRWFLPFFRLVLVSVPTYLVHKIIFLGLLVLLNRCRRSWGSLVYFTCPFHCCKFNLRRVPREVILRNNL